MNCSFQESRFKWTDGTILPGRTVMIISGASPGTTEKARKRISMNEYNGLKFGVLCYNITKNLP
jgi:hypothetical protein